jgi:hypothetical protein
MGVNIVRRTPQTNPNDTPCNATPKSEPGSRFRSGGLGGFFRNKKTPAKTNQQISTTTKTNVGQTSKLILILLKAARIQAIQEYKLWLAAPRKETT